jgi:hypothetical protein
MSHSTQNTDFNIDVEELTEDHPKVQCPFGVNISLKPHQQTLLARCALYENSMFNLKDFKELSNTVDEDDYFKTNIAVLGDRVGSGKSYVILALIASNDITCKNNIIIKSHGFNKVMYYVHDKKQAIKTNLLVIPHNLAIQWECYIKTFGGNMKYKIVKTQKALDSLLQEENAVSPAMQNDENNNVNSAPTSSTHNVKKSVERISTYNLIVVTSTLYNKLAQFLSVNKIKVQRAIYDEVDNLNIPGSKHIDANFFWFVTASYGNILYPRGHNKYEDSIGRFVWYANGMKHSGFLKNILLDLSYNISRSLMKVLIIKNKEGYVEKSLSLPEMVSHYILCKTPYTIQVLNGLVDRNILNHLNADDVQGALAYVSPTHKSTEDNIIRRVLDKFVRQTTNIKLQLSTAQEYLYDTDLERQVEIQKLEKQLETISNKINMITNRIKESDLCTICYDTAENKTITLCCQNSFCFKCINLWLSQKNVCPLCKTNMDLTDLYVIDNAVVEDNDNDNISYNIQTTNEKNDKYQNLEVILQNIDDKAKILLFSAYENSFNNVIPILRNNNIQFEYLKGNGNQTNCTVERYKTGQTKVLLVNTRQYGSGLCLENTTDMIMFHKFDTEIEKQVIGRAQRYGRKEPLNVHYLLYENEMPSQAPI